MPSLGRSTKKSVGMLGTARSFFSILRELSFDEVRDEATRMPRLLVLAEDQGMAAGLGRLLTGVEASGAVAPRALSDPGDLGGFEAIVVQDPTRSGAAERLRQRTSAPVIELTGWGHAGEGTAAQLRQQIVAALPERATAFGRAFPAFRSVAVRTVVDETAKANAQFALVANIPAVIPLVGSFAAAGADFLVLTKNQLLLIYKIAAIHGRDLSDQAGIVRELMPVVGAGLLWRTVAREAASFIPFAAGTIPKVAIAFTGTVAAGRAADFYYRFGQKPTGPQMREFYRQAAESLKKLPLPMGGGSDGGKDRASAG